MKPKFSDDSPTNRNLYLIDKTLKKAGEYGLEAEVMWSALIAAAEANEHGKSLEQVLEEAMDEWDI